jgi:hypothetical protein
MIVHLVAFEAWNITRFLFVTNKRREIAGASELVTHLDSKWVGSALGEIFDGFDVGWRIEEQPAELVPTGAGTVKVLVRDRDLARCLVTKVTVTALCEAPGLDVYGLVSEPFVWGDRALLAGTARAVAERMGSARASRPGPDSRFLRLPLADECLTTGLPASLEVTQPDGGTEPRSAESHVKWRAYGSRDEGEGLARLAELGGVDTRTLAKVVEYLQDDAEWVAVVHVDGNGFGDIFGNFDKLVDGDSARAYADTLRLFTAQLERCARDALAEAHAAVRAHPVGRAAAGHVPVLPLILGGDDVVLLCDGRLALPFIVAFLRGYERLTGEAEAVSVPLRRSGRPGTLTASAGVAIVKTHHPFESALRLANDLLLEAKQVKVHVKGPCSGLAFHVLYDSTDVRLQRLRGHDRRERRPHSLVAQPYVVSAGVAGDGWTVGRRWDDLVDRVTAIRAVDADGERMLPSTQLHELRRALFAGPDIADARLAAMLPRYRCRGLQALCGEGDSVFWTEPSTASGTERRISGLMDAMDAADFWMGGEE